MKLVNIIIIIIIIITFNCKWDFTRWQCYYNKTLRGPSPPANLRDRRLSEKLMATFEGRGCRVVSATDSNDRILGFLDRSRYFFFQVAPQLYSRA
jgi:hypothetical protein